VLGVHRNYVSMTRLAMKLLGARITHVARAHIAGCWVSVWVRVALP
jgi:hypothetical protein